MSTFMLQNAHFEPIGQLLAPRVSDVFLSRCFPKKQRLMPAVSPASLANLQNENQLQLLKQHSYHTPLHDHTSQKTSEPSRAEPSQQHQQQQRNIMLQLQAQVTWLTDEHRKLLISSIEGPHFTRDSRYYCCFDAPTLPHTQPRLPVSLSLQRPPKP
ncbi:hypothetical protein CPB84DRAFT_581162 [Gymnopilus junonius]|uniref:Uncharacterized protein n=1 Tax=Gymnopilus junonius TaxID=109634 RepID=A0A9P5TFF7_GYMJU|nr:hypothetical protein CPB84DRAFT_581162 [Gymnopilus junonius]